MKKSIKLFILLGILISPLTAKALTGNATLSCDKTKLSGGQSTTCTLKGNASNGKVSNISAQIKVSNNLELEGFKTANIWQGSGENGDIELYTDVDKEGNFAIGTFTVKAKANIIDKDESIEVSGIKFYDEVYKPLEITSVAHNIRILSTDNTLRSLTIQGASIDFNPNTTTYNVTLDKESTVITATKNNSHASVTGAGTKQLNYGNNSFEITVTSEAGAKKIYIINITRPDNRSKNNNLGVLKIKDYNIQFDKNKTDYQITVPYSTEQLSFYIEREDEKATIKEIFSTGIFYDEEAMEELEKLIEEGKLKEEDRYYIIKGLKVGENTLTFKITAENETTKTYTIKVTRQNEKGKLPAQTVNVPDTGVTVSPLTITLGIILIVMGIGVVIYIIKRKEIKKWFANKNKDYE